jgi:SMC interacting uncharacterized protein involved in chromosome segregation
MNSLPVLESERFLRAIGWRQVSDMDEQIQVRITRLESDVQHIQRDVSDIKVDLRHTNDKLDVMILRISGVEVKLGERTASTEEKLTEKITSVEEKLTEKITSVEEKLTEKITGVEERLTGKITGVEERLTGKITGVEEKLTGKITGVEEKLTGKIEGLRQEMASMKVWAMGMYFALAGSLLFVMAKGFKWI